MKNKILIVVDAQHDFVDGALANKDAQAVIPKLVDYLRFNTLGVYNRIYFTRDTHHDDYLNTPEGKKLPVEHCIEGTSGWCVMDELIAAIKHNFSFVVPQRSAVYVDKHTFGYKDWENTFKKYNDDEIDEITLVGFCTSICVVSNALILKALYPNANVRVLSEFCADITPEKHEAALEVMKSCQIEVI